MHLLQQESIRRLYYLRLLDYIDQRAVSTNINEEWHDLKDIIIKAAGEALGSRSTKKRKKGLYIWNDEIQEIIENKKRAYLKYIQSKSEDDRTEYKYRSAIAKKEVRKLKRLSWDNYISNIEYDCHGSQDIAYKILKHLNSTEKDTVKINNITEKEWLKYYETLWTNSTEVNTNPKLMELANVDLIEIEELENALKTFKNKKTPGIDCINIELLKYAPKEVKERFLDIINVCWRMCIIPDEWKKGLICPIFKKGNRHECTSYRGICLLSIAYKIYAKIITRRLNVINEHILREEQCGFRKGRSCSDAIFTIEQLIQKRREFNLPTCILFIDYEKAFDRLSRNKLWEIMSDKGFPEHIVKVVQSLYFKSNIIIDKGGPISDSILEINQGVRQGCPLSPALFSIYIDEVIGQWQLALTTDFKINNKILNTILFADDQTIFGDSESDLQLAVHKLNEIAKKFNMTISESKSKVMAFNGKDHMRCKISINGSIIEQVNNFNYLGCNVSYCQKEDINIKLNKFYRMCGTIKRTLKNKTLQSTQLKFYKVMAVPTLTYASENWTLNRSDRRKIETAEMKFLRSIAGVTILDRRRNEDIRKDLKIFNLTNRIESMRNNWYEHVRRMPTDRIPQQLLQYKPRGRRSVGRPITRWEDSLKFT